MGAICMNYKQHNKRCKKHSYEFCQICKPVTAEELKDWATYKPVKKSIIKSTMNELEMFWYGKRYRLWLFKKKANLHIWWWFKQHRIDKWLKKT